MAGVKTRRVHHTRAAGAESAMHYCLVTDAGDSQAVGRAISGILIDAF